MSTDGNKRRAKGEGRIFYRNDRDRWVAQYRMPNGKYKYFSGRTSVDVTRKLNAARGATAPPIEQQHLPALARKEHIAAMLVQTQEQLRDARRALEQVRMKLLDPTAANQIISGFFTRHPSSAD